MTNLRTLRCILVLSVMTLLGRTGCSDMGNGVHPDLFLISGSWLWVRSTGGIGGDIITPSPGEVLKDVYTLEGAFSRFRNDTLILSARFSVFDGPFGVTLKLTDFVKHPGYRDSDPTYPFGWFDWLGEEILTFRGDSMLLADYGNDTYFHTFVRWNA